MVRSGIVLGEDTGAVICGEEEDGVDGEEGEVGRHGELNTYRIYRGSGLVRGGFALIRSPCSDSLCCG